MDKKEAIKILKDFHDKSALFSVRTALETLHPELKESEDEKIRKFLIKWIQDNYYHGTTEIPTKTLIGWLEKQGKAEPKWCHHKVDLSGCSEEYRKAYYDGWNNCNQQHSQCKSEENDVVKCLINGMKFYYEGNEEATWGTEKFSMKVRDILSWLKKQGEQNHEIKYIYPKFRVGDVIEPAKPNGSYIPVMVRQISAGSYYCESDDRKAFSSIPICNENEYVLTEQKPAEWSEEDEQILQGIWDEILANKHDAKECEWKTYDKFLDWLKSIKNRFIPQPKQEWSKEDNDMLYKVVHRIERLDHYWNAPTDEKMIEWLKSLRPQNHWKPSEEQMEAIRIAANVGTANDSWAMGILRDMYNDLKKEYGNEGGNT